MKWSIIFGMRREWSDAIRNRRWDELERLAKWEPDQQLCDTVAELAEGLDAKADRKALRRILWSLEKEGITPTPREHSEVAASDKPLEFAFMMSADAMGDTPITYGFQQGSKFRWITAYLNETKGIKRASDETMKVEDAKIRADRLRSENAPPFLSGEIEPAFALWRMKRALAKNKPGTVPEAIAYWRSILDRAEDSSHPVADSKMGKIKTPEADEILLMEPTLPWRIELGAATPVLERMYEAQQLHKGDDEEAQREAVKAAGAEARRDIITQEVVDDHLMRLRDLALLMQAKGDETAMKVLATAKDLEKNGADSAYAKGLVDKTVVVYVETMKQAEARRSAG